MAERRDIVNFSEHCDPSSATGALFISRLLDDERRRVRSDDWATSAVSLDGIGETVLTMTGRGRESAVVELDGTLVFAVLGVGRVFASVAGTSDHELDRTFAALRERLPIPDLSAAHEVTVTFWTYTPHGPQPSWRTISVPGWEEIRGNYGADTRDGLDRLMDDFEPAHGGQLVLWHGTAGTGKTFALRALAWEWRSWCDLHYIVDPDSFFGEHADYLMSVLLQPGPVGVGWTRYGPVPVDVHDEDQEGGDKPWRLLVLEDTGELLTPDAKTLIGQGLSRFLNVVDGLIGQGLRVLVLVTTNEPIRTLHPAVARPGRCAANVQFVPLDRDEAAKWLTEHGVDETVERPQILASLYSRLEGRGAVDAAQAAGFAGSA
jgi:hypothetical protein